MDGKRRLSSDGKTPKPANKSTKMAEQKQECSRVKNYSSDSQYHGLQTNSYRRGSTEPTRRSALTSITIRK